MLSILYASMIRISVRTVASGTSAEAMAITSRAFFHAPPPPAGPLV
jgi:hypothetical protein